MAGITQGWRTLNTASSDMAEQGKEHADQETGQDVLKYKEYTVLFISQKVTVHVHNGPGHLC